MADKKYVGTFQSEHEVLDKIDELKGQGFLEEDMYIVANDVDALAMVRVQTNVDLESADGNWLHRFKAYLNGDEPVKAAFTNMGFTEEESIHYYNQVKTDGILLYVDRDYNDLAHNHEAELLTNHVDANFGSNLPVDHMTHVNGNETNNINQDRYLDAHDKVESAEEVERRENLNNPILQGELKATDDSTVNEAGNDIASTSYEDFDLETERERLRNDSLAGHNRLL